VVATGEGVNRYDGNSFLVYENDPSDPGTLSHNFIRDVFEDDDDEFRLRMRDDGKGIDSEVLAAQGIKNHYGLRGVQERAAVIGGNLTVWSEVGGRTEVQLRLDAHNLYATSATRSWWSRLFPSRTTT
jgi:hypothetical protein